MNTSFLKNYSISILEGSYTRASPVLLMCCLAFSVVVSAVEAKAISDVKTDVKVVGTTEFGFLGVTSHQIQFGRTGAEFDYVREGGQDVLFFFSRYSLEVTLFQAHNISFLYQPLDIESSVILDRDIVIDEQDFSTDTPMDLRYGFRMSENAHPAF